MVRDVFCKACKAKLGWIYEFATEESQKYKEGKFLSKSAEKYKSTILFIF